MEKSILKRFSTLFLNFLIAFDLIYENKNITFNKISKKFEIII